VLRTGSDEFYWQSVLHHCVEHAPLQPQFDINSMEAPSGMRGILVAYQP